MDKIFNRQLSRNYFIRISFSLLDQAQNISQTKYYTFNGYLVTSYVIEIVEGGFLGVSGKFFCTWYFGLPENLGGP